jgi:hypothetical protein
LAFTRNCGNNLNNLMPSTPPHVKKMNIVTPIFSNPGKLRFVELGNRASKADDFQSLWFVVFPIVMFV